jgi:hypothetical protein
MCHLGCQDAILNDLPNLYFNCANETDIDIGAIRKRAMNIMEIACLKQQDDYCVGIQQRDINKNESLRLSSVRKFHFDLYCSECFRRQIEFYNNIPKIRDLLLFDGPSSLTDYCESRNHPFFVELNGNYSELDFVPRNAMDELTRSNGSSLMAGIFGIHVIIGFLLMLI